MSRQQNWRQRSSTIEWSDNGEFNSDGTPSGKWAFLEIPHWLFLLCCKRMRSFCSANYINDVGVAKLTDALKTNTTLTYLSYWYWCYGFNSCTIVIQENDGVVLFSSSWPLFLLIRFFVIFQRFTFRPKYHTCFHTFFMFGLNNQLRQIFLWGGSS